MTVMVVLSMDRFRITVANVAEIRADGVFPQVYDLPRFLLNVDLGVGSGHEVLCFRYQFPVSGAASITFDRSQSQEFSDLVLDMRVVPFAHGQLNFAFGRATDPKLIKVVSYETKIAVVLHPEVRSMLEGDRARKRRRLK